MIKIFRRIRQKLLIENKFNKYLIYATGEILLVVIGILIAVQVNNWNEKRKSHNYEKQLLIQLRKDLKSNISDLENNISLQKRVVNSSRILSEHFDRNLPYHDSLVIHFSNTAFWTKFIVNAGAYKTIESKGLDLISNLELRDLVFNIYEGKLNWLHQLEGSIIVQVENFRVNEAVHYFKMWTPIQIIDDKYAKGNTVIKNYDQIKNGESFRYYLNSIHNQDKLLLKVTNDYLENNMKCIELIEEILNIMPE